jgi:hypothetical protein
MKTMDIKPLLNLRDLSQRVALPSRRFLFTLAASVLLLMWVLLLFGIWSFAQYERERLTEPVSIKQVIPTLKRDELTRFVRRLQLIPGPLPATPSPRPSPPSRAPARIQLVP